jgi:chitodextrinase
MNPQNQALRFDARSLRNFLLALLIGAALAAPADAGSTKFIPTFLVYYGGGPTLTAADAPKLAKFDLIDIDRFRYNQIGGNTWLSIKALNPEVQIYLYEMGPESTNYMDGAQPVSLNNLGRYDVSRGHSMGALNGNNSALFLLNASGQRIHNVAYSNVSQNRYWHLMDFGSPDYQQYWIESAKADVFDQPWAADGLFVDNCLTFSAAGGYSATSAKYPTNAAWSAAMNAFTNGITAGAHAHGQKLWCNKGDTTTADGSAAWLALDDGASPPDVLLEEGAFAVKWGNGVTQFFPEANWKRQVDTMGAMRTTSVAMLAHTKLFEGQSGTDNWGQPVSFGQTLWYALGSFLLGKNDALGNSYFTFVDGSSYNKVLWFEEYDRIDLGRALGAYQVASIGGVNLYWREFERGYVYVNPTTSNIASIPLPQPGRALVRETLATLAELLPIVTTIPLKGHHAAFVLKTTETPATDTQAPAVPTGLAATAVSGTQVNLAWNASTDNVGVTGYYVYLNDQPLATTTATSFSHTGLTTGTTYNYRVSAYDAVPNHSAWSAAVAATPAVADTQAPSVPTGLTATAVSGTQVNLAWIASTDNVGVTGYYVYLNDAPLAATSATAFSHTGLTAGGTYRYRVSAFDAVPNHSAWTASPVSVTTPVVDTQAPSVPTGLTATAVSGTQVNLSWNASTDNVGVTGYSVYLNDAPLATTTATSFSHTGLTSGNTYNYRVSAFDAVPNHSAWSASPVAVKTADTVAPAVSITSPLSGAKLQGMVTITASATDNVGVVGVQFQYNGINLGAEDTSAPYSVTAHTKSVPNGSFTLTAIARDAAGNRSISAPITVSVKN